MANIIGFRGIYKIKFIKSNKKHNILNLNGILLIKRIRVLVKIK